MNAERLHREKVIQYYDLAQRFYELLWCGDTMGLHYGIWTPDTKNRKEAIIKENEILADLTGVKNGDLVLDAGCGVQGSGVWLAKNRGAKVVGLNIVRSQLKIGKDLAQKRSVSSKLDFVQGDFHILPFADNSFDVFWSLESIEHATNIEGFIGEAYRVTRPGGRIAIAATFRGRKDISEKEQRQFQVGLDVSGAFNDFRTANAVGEVMRAKGFTNVTNFDRTENVMKSAREMTRMCRWGLPVAKVLATFGAVSPIIAKNNQWGLYQEELFKSGATSYNILVAQKPK